MVTSLQNSIIILTQARRWRFLPIVIFSLVTLSGVDGFSSTSAGIPETTMSAIPVASEPPLNASPPVVEPDADLQEPTHEPFIERPLTVAYALSVFSVPLPMKQGVALSYAISKKWMFELSYQTAQVGLNASWGDIGSFSETLVSLDARRSEGGSFNWLFGLARQSYEAHLGSTLLRSVSNGAKALDLVRTETLDAHLGLGNRWQFSNGAAFSADWLTINIPFLTLKSESPASDQVTNADDKQKIDDILKLMRSLPTGSVIRLTIGYSF
jgi:hypothetical protein